MFITFDYRDTNQRHHCNSAEQALHFLAGFLDTASAPVTNLRIYS